MRLWLVSLLILFSFIGCNESKPEIKASGEVVHIGIIFANDDALMHKRLQIFELFQKHWGLLKNGDQLTLHAVSAEGEALSCFNKLIKKEKLAVVISFLDSTTMLDLKESIEKNKIPVISVIATHSKINDIKYVSRICLNNPWQANVAAAYIRDELFIANIDVITDEKNDFSVELSNLFKERYTKIGGNVITTIASSILKDDPEAFVKQMNENKINALFSTIDAGQTKRLLQVLQRVDHEVKILAHDGLLSAFKTKFPKDVSLLNGILVIDNYADNVKILKKGKNLRHYKLDKNEHFLDSYNGLSYDSWSLMKQALNACKTYESECLNDYMRNTASVEGIVETFRMENGNALRAVYVNKIEHKKMKVQVKVY